MKHFYNLRLFDEATAGISRTDAEALIREQLAPEIIQGAVSESAVLRMGTRLPDMTSAQTRMPVLDTLPMAYFVEGDTGSKQETKQAWKNKYINAAEIAAIVTVPESVLDDSEYDIPGQVVPRISEAVGKVIDAAVLFGVNKPANWPESVYKQATDAGAIVNSGLSLYDDLLGVGGAISKVEESGYMSNGHIASISMRAALRSVKDNDGRPIFTSNMQESANYSLDGSPIMFSRNGAFDKTKARLITGDFTQLVYAIRKDIDVKIFDQGVVQDPTTGEIVANLMQNDMIAIRVVMRLGWQLPNPVNAENNTASRLPFAVLAPAAPASASYGMRRYSGDDVEYTQEQLNKMTIDQIKDLAADKGYEITAGLKADIVNEFLAAQFADGNGGGTSGAAG